MTNHIDAHLAPDGRIRVNVEAEPYLDAEDIVPIARLAAAGLARSIGRQLRGEISVGPAANMGNGRIEYHFTISTTAPN